jgi:hypothetical protein
VNPEYRFGWNKSFWEILASYREWYDAGLTDVEVSAKMRETYPVFSKPFTQKKRPEKPERGSPPNKS